MNIVEPFWLAIRLILAEKMKAKGYASDLQIYSVYSRLHAQAFPPFLSPLSEKQNKVRGKMAVKN